MGLPIRELPGELAGGCDSSAGARPTVRVPSPPGRPSCIMRKSQFSETQIVGILKEAEAGVAVNDLLWTHDINRAIFFKCRSKYGGASVSTMTRLRELEAEHAKLKRMYADLALENAAIKDVLARQL